MNSFFVVVLVGIGSVIITVAVMAIIKDSQADNDKEEDCAGACIMTKAKIIFNLDDPDEEEKLKTVMQAEDMKLAVWEFDQWLRSQHKHGPSGILAQYVEVGCETCKADVQDIVFDIRGKLREILNEAGVQVDQ